MALVVDVVALVLDVVVAVAVPAAVVGVHAGQEDQVPAVLVAAAVEVSQGQLRELRGLTYWR